MHNFGLINLVLAIFRHTAQDIKYGKTECRNWTVNEETGEIEHLKTGESIRVNLKDEANEFLECKWFEEMCELFKDIPPTKIRKMIRENSVAWRDKYE